MTKSIQAIISHHPLHNPQKKQGKTTHPFGGGSELPRLKENAEGLWRKKRAVLYKLAGMGFIT